MDIVKQPSTHIKTDGSYIHKYELIKGLLYCDNIIHVLHNENDAKIYINKLIYHKVPKTNEFKRLKYAIFLLRIVRIYHFDILYTRTPANVSGIVGYTSKKMFGIPLVFEINGIAFEEQRLIRNKSESGGKKSSVLAKFRKYKEIFMWKRADAIIAVTEGIKQFLVQHGVDERRIHVIENGANIELFKPLDHCVCHHELGLDANYKYVCFVGNLAPWQGLEYLVKAAPFVLSKIKAKFLIVGDGIMRGQLEAKVDELGVADDFIFTGIVPYEDVPKYINASDVCVAPFIKTRNEKIGLSPLKIYEYMACGKPVISSRISNLEFIEVQKSGILVEPENHSELAKAIIGMLEDNKSFRSGRDYILKCHSWKNVAHKVYEICKNVVLSK